MTDRQDGIGEPDGLERLWTPYRMAYLRGENKPADGTSGECPFCRIPRLDDDAGLVVRRGETAYAVLNLYPYAPGHLMVCPYRHIADYTEMTDEESAEIAEMTRAAMRTVRTVSHAEGFNVGMNQGAAGGAGIAGAPAPARGAAVGRRRQLHADHRAHQDAPAAAPGHPGPARGGLGGLSFGVVPDRS